VQITWWRITGYPLCFFSGLNICGFFTYPVAIAAKEINELWMEYEANLSPEAKVVKDLDKVHVFSFYILYDLQMLSLNFTLLLMDNSFTDSLSSHQ